MDAFFVGKTFVFFHVIGIVINVLIIDLIVVVLLVDVCVSCIVYRVCACFLRLRIVPRRLFLFSKPIIWNMLLQERERPAEPR